MYRILEYKGNEKYQFINNPGTNEPLEIETKDTLEEELKELLKEHPLKDLVVVSVENYLVDLIFSSDTDV